MFAPGRRWGACLPGRANGYCLGRAEGGLIGLTVRSRRGGIWYSFDRTDAANRESVKAVGISGDITRRPYVLHFFAAAALIPLSGAPLILGGCSGQGRTATRPAFSQKIKYVVVIFQENRTPDNLFHDLPGADIANSGTNSAGEKIPLTTVPLANGGFSKAKNNSRRFLLGVTIFRDKLPIIRSTLGLQFRHATLSL
jgi:hypothetical protein